MGHEKITIAVTVEGEMAKRWEAVKKEIGLQKNADLVRLLITEKFKNLGLVLQLPRFEKVNNDENGVKILDRTNENHFVADVTFNREGVWCNHCQADSCEHIDFALSLAEVQKIIKTHKKEGWKLPDV